MAIHVCYASVDKRKKKKKIASQNNYTKGKDISGIMNRTGPVSVELIIMTFFFTTAVESCICKMKNHDFQNQ